MGLVGDGNFCGSGCFSGDFYALDFGGWDCSDGCCGVMVIGVLVFVR